MANKDQSVGGDDFLAFSSSHEQQQPSSQKSQHFRPYNNSFRNRNQQQQQFSPQGFSSPIGGSYRGANRPRFNEAGGGEGRGRGAGSGGNRSFGKHRQNFNRRGGGSDHHHNNSRGGSFQRINFQAAGSGDVRI